MITALLVRIQTRLRDRDDTGATAVEYGLLLVFIVAVVGGTIVALGDEVQNAFQSAVDQFTGGGD